MKNSIKGYMLLLRNEKDLNLLARMLNFLILTQPMWLQQHPKFPGQGGEGEGESPYGCLAVLVNVKESNVIYSHILIS